MPNRIKRSFSVSLSKRKRLLAQEGLNRNSGIKENRPNLLDPRLKRAPVVKNQTREELKKKMGMTIIIKKKQTNLRL